MNNLRSSIFPHIDESQELIFQCIDWMGTNEYVKEENTNPRSKKKFISKYKHVIKLFGITEKGESVSVNINDYNPYFYIKVPDSIDEVNKIKIINAIKQSVDSKVADGLIDTKIVAQKDFYGFTNQKMYTFLKLIFNNSYSMSKIGKELTRGIAVNSKKTFFKVYESNITPFIRYIHNRKVEACGWVKLKPFTYTVNEPKTTTSMI